MSLLTLTGAGKHFGAERILESVSFKVERGDHIGLVGSNGAGKSTLLRIVAGIEEPDSGSVARARGLHVVYLPQEPQFDPAHTLYEAMLDTFRAALDAQERLRVLEHEMAGGRDDLELIEEYGRLQGVIEHTGYNYREQIERVLEGLGLRQDSWYTPISNLSGGQQTRANLARTLLQEADVLLLDEPTNHLDIQAVEWLEAYLRDLKRAFVIVAHDRYLLDHVTKRTVELSFGHAAEYDAPYSRYVELKAERMERQRLDYEAQQRHIAKTEEFVRRFGANQRAKEARGRQKQLDRLERVARPADEGQVQLRLTKAQRSGDIVLQADHLTVGYPDQPLARLPEQVTVRRGERVAIIGPNGSGKTTLLRTLVGALPALDGTVRWGARTSIGYYSQTLGQLNDSRTVLEEVQRTTSMSEEEARGFLGRFLFSGDDVLKTIGMLSGGEKSRVALARLILEAPNVLVLDEPTNHLDLASRDALQDVLEEFQGTLLFVSHDRYLIDSLAQQLWVVRDGAMTRYDGAYSAYAGGSARPLDRVQVRSGPEPWRGEASNEARLRQLEDEAEALAALLAESGPTTSLGNLIELMERYGDVLSLLQEAQQAWLETVRSDLRASSA